MSGDGERTVFRPNPGGRRPPPPASPPGPPTPAAAPAYNPATAPAYNTPAAPIPSAVPSAQTDDWIASRSSDRASSAGLPRAQDLRFDDLVAPNANPLLRSAGPLLLLLGRLRVVALQASLASLMEQVAEAINFYEKDIYAAGVPAEPAKTAKYLICATADDIVQNIPTEDRHVWTQYSMLSRFFGERIGGVRFFDELDRLLVDPAAHYDLLELQHACLALGFQGRYRSDPNGASTLQTRPAQPLRDVASHSLPLDRAALASLGGSGARRSAQPLPRADLGRVVAAAAAGVRHVPAAAHLARLRPARRSRPRRKRCTLTPGSPCSAASPRRRRSSCRRSRRPVRCSASRTRSAPNSATA